MSTLNWCDKCRMWTCCNHIHWTLEESQQFVATKLGLPIEKVRANWEEKTNRRREAERNQ